MKRIFLLTLLCFCYLAAISQKSKKPGETYYAFDKNWKPCEIDSAMYLSMVKKINDTSYQWYNYHFSGPLISVETYKDQDYSVLNGFIAYYDKEGRIDSSGYTKNGRRDKTWYFYSDTLSMILQKDYDDGILLRTIDLEAKRKEDALKEKAPDGFEKDEKEAEFKGGSSAWVKYLQKNIQFPKRAENLNKSGQVMIGFTVDAEGNIKDIYIAKSVELSLDKEAWRLIEESPRWEPAFQKGRNVKAYRRQPISFLTSN